MKIFFFHPLICACISLRGISANVGDTEDSSFESHAASSTFLRANKEALRDLKISNPLPPSNFEPGSSCYPSDAIDRISEYAPVWDFDMDSCLPAPAISSTGVQNRGLNIGGGMTDNCRDSNFMQKSNTLHKWNRFQVGEDVYEAHMYELYFEKDQTIFGSFMYWNKAGGHKHDLENVLIMFKNGHPYLVGASAHGKYIKKSWSDAPKIGNHVKIVYHSDDGGFNTHAFRFAKSGENSAENPTGQWVCF